ncbi:MAG TPA: glycosyltransferase family 39 protein [Planctomycetota bacterium]|nr:glycosyltransferase family 39 protein [Planctomycetota bacterium]
MAPPLRRLLLAGILALGAALRGAGLRAFPVADESQAVATAIYLETTGEGVPPSANWPPAIYSLLRGAIRAGIALGVHPSLDAVREEFAKDWVRRPGALHLETRAVSIACGLGLIAAAYAIGGRIAGSSAGLLAALGVAISPLACAYSRYALTDAPHALAAAASLLLALVHLGSGGRAAFLGSAALAGVAFSTKYLGALALLAPLAALRGPVGPSRAVAAAALAGMGFLAGAFLAAPSLFLHPSAYLRWLGVHAEATGWEWLGFEGEPRGWLYHALRTIPWSLGGPLLVAAAALGLAWALRHERRRCLVLLAFAVPYYLVVGTNRILYARYLLPLVPVLAVFGAAGIVRALPAVVPGRLPARAGIAAFGALAFGGALLDEIGRARAIAGPDTRRLAMEWMEKDLPAGTRVLTAVPVYVPGFEFLPDFAYPPADAKRFAWKNLAHRSDRRSRLAFDAASREADVYVWTGFVDPLLEAKPGLYPDYAAFSKDLAGAPLLAVFDPGGRPDRRIPREEWSGLGVSGRACTKAGPAIRIYRLKGE